jgi:hypothetical protein
MKKTETQQGEYPYIVGIDVSITIAIIFIDFINY